MSYKNYYQMLVFLALLQSSLLQRRIKNGFEVTTDKAYMVYLLRAQSSPVKYSGWLCGGAILSEEYVLTSAACVADVQHMYIIPGYKKYISEEKLATDECIQRMRKKVILTCIPKEYRFDYNKTELWSKTDIAVVKVESSFNFHDDTYKTYCSYIPRAINFNVDATFPKLGDNAIVLGWGHTKSFRQEKDLTNLNQEILHYAPVKIHDEKVCATYFKENQELSSNIIEAMLCSLEEGYLDDTGALLVRSGPDKRCITLQEKFNGSPGDLCHIDDKKIQKEDSDDEITFDDIIVIPEENVVRRTNSGAEEIRRDVNIFELDITSTHLEATTPESEEAPECPEDTTEVTEKASIQEPLEETTTVFTETDITTKSTEEIITTEPIEETISREPSEKNIGKIKSENREISSESTGETISTERTGETITTEPTEKTITSTESTGETISMEPTGEIISTEPTEDTIISTESTGKTISTERTGETISTEPTETITTDDYTTEKYTEDGESLLNVDTAGICQNDHGGPLIAWKGGEEIVVGVATLFKLNEDHECRGPYLFTKTEYNKLFLDCILNHSDDNDKKKSANQEDGRRCNVPSEIGFEIVRRRISWIGHHDGPADNEPVLIRHQVPLSVYNMQSL